LTPGTIIRSERDARFHMPPRKLDEVLRHFGAELERAHDAPSMLIVVAHQDDESIGAGAQLARLPDVTVLHVTDGSPRDPAYVHRFGYSSADEYGEARRREAAEALRLAGVPAERQLCLNIPDGEAPYHLVELSLTIAALLDELCPDVVLTHPYEGGHTDHDAIAFAVHLACGILRREGVRIPMVLELTSYHNRNGRRVVHDFLPYDNALNTRTCQLSRAARELKVRMYECFSTQQKCLTQFSVDIERFRPAPRYIFTRPPHDGTLDYERLSRRMSYTEWRDQAQRALGQLRTRRRGKVSMQSMTVAAPSTSSTADTQFVHAA
ncbi:MAG TPA: PIG-L family deacetylase, partial [Longimicrobiales bacterium]|nr:PIG-L family deacetylase [Longimicrobiales bacterium]